MKQQEAERPTQICFYTRAFVIATSDLSKQNSSNVSDWLDFDQRRDEYKHASSARWSARMCVMEQFKNAFKYAER